MAGFNNNNSDDELISSINVTPLVDIMLVLLIIFMLVSTFMLKEAIEIELPHAATGAEIKTLTVSVLISKTGEYFISGQKYESFEALQTKMAQTKQENSDVQVVISADKMAYHGAVIRVIDMIRKLDIYKFAINVEYQE